jgi:hypothetical protein
MRKKSKTIAVSLLIIFSAVSIILYLVMFFGGHSNVANCFDIPSYIVNQNGTLSMRIISNSSNVSASYINKSTITSLISGYAKDGCCGESALNAIGQKVAVVYNLSLEFNNSLYSASVSCEPGVYN